MNGLEASARQFTPTCGTEVLQRAHQTQQPGQGALLSQLPLPPINPAAFE